MGRKLISSDEAVQSDVQHTRPCSDCPWSRKSLEGWLGGHSVEDWLQTAHGDAPELCHVIDNQQCAGISIYRANICKQPRHPQALRLPADRVVVFAWPTEFAAHHSTDGGEDVNE